MVGQSARRLLDVAPLDLTDPNTGVDILNQAINSFLGSYEILGDPQPSQVCCLIACRCTCAVRKFASPP